MVSRERREKEAGAAGPARATRAASSGRVADPPAVACPPIIAAPSQLRAVIPLTARGGRPANRAARPSTPRGVGGAGPGGRGPVGGPMRRDRHGTLLTTPGRRVPESAESNASLVSWLNIGPYMYVTLV